MFQLDVHFHLINFLNATCKCVLNNLNSKFYDKNKNCTVEYLCLCI